jgi:nucleoside-diphosphate-sugar epimerase
MKALVVGGTGFIGYHSVKEFIRRGYPVTVVARRPSSGGDLFPKEVRMVCADIDELAQEELRSLLDGHDAIVYAAGADDRTTQKAPAYDFFYKANVKSCARLFSIARQAGVKRGVLLSSYFLYFDRLWPDMKLPEHHPYIRSRKEQAEESLKVAMPDLQLMVLELPYIFGSAPGRIPLWKPLIDYIDSSFPLFYSKGGTNMIAVEHVAEAIVGAVEVGKGGERYTIGDENLTWADFLEELSDILGRKKRVITIPTFLVRVLTMLLRLTHKLQGKESGLDPVRFTDIQTLNTFFDPSPSIAALGYGRGGLRKAFRETVDACLGSKGSKA